MREEFNLQLRNPFKFLSEETTDSVTEKQNKIIKDDYLNTCENVIGYKNTKKKPTDFWENMDEITWWERIKNK